MKNKWNKAPKENAANENKQVLHVVDNNIGGCEFVQILCED